MRTTFSARALARPLPSLRDMIRDEAEARQLSRRARRLDATAAKAPTAEVRSMAEARALLARRELVKRRLALRLLDLAELDRDALLAAVDGWLEDEEIAAAALDRLAAALELRAEEAAA